MQTPLRPYILIRNFSTIPPKPLQWLWQPRIPRGKITLLAGDPASGKTTLLLHLASLLSRNIPMPLTPLETRNPKLETPLATDHSPLATLLLSPEDNLADTLRPKLDALHADLSQIHTLPDLHSLSEHTHIIHPETHQPLSPLQYLEAAIEAIPNLALLIIDPITYYLGLSDRLQPKLNSPQAQGLNPCGSPRSTLQSLSLLAEKYNLAILLTTRLTKSLPQSSVLSTQSFTQSLRRSLGSLAFTSAARSVLLLLPNPSPQNPPAMVPTPPSAIPTSTLPPSPHLSPIENPKSKIPSPLETRNSTLETPPSHLLLTIKSNLTETPPPLAFTLTDQITWHESIPTLPGDTPHPKPLTQHQLNENTFLAEAASFLQKFLAEGPKKVTAVKHHASDLGISQITLRRARIHLKINSQYSKYQSAWYHSLPDDTRPIPTPQEELQNEMITFEKSDKLFAKLKEELML